MLRYFNIALPLLLLLIVLISTVVISPSNLAASMQDKLLQQAAITFALAKSLNALISLFQSVSINATPVGMGITISIGELLDPLNDMVERFSLIMLASTIALGVQKIILELSSSLYLAVALFLSAFATWLSYLYAYRTALFNMALKIVLFLLLLRYLTLIYLLLQNLLFTTTIEPIMLKERAQIEQTNTALQQIKRQEQQRITHQQSWYERIKQGGTILVSLQESAQKLQARLQNMKHDFIRAMESMTALMTQFILLTIMLPLLYIWLSIRLIQWIFTMRLTADAPANTHTFQTDHPDAQ